MRTAALMVHRPPWRAHGPIPRTPVAERGTMRFMESPDARHIGLIVVDHGSRRGASNEMLEVMAGMVADVVPYGIVEPAHMELAEPSIQTAFDRCVARGAKMVVVSPYFPAARASLAPGHPRPHRRGCDPSSRRALSGRRAPRPASADGPRCGVARPALPGPRGRRSRRVRGLCGDGPLRRRLRRTRRSAARGHHVLDAGRDAGRAHRRRPRGTRCRG